MHLVWIVGATAAVAAGVQSAVAFGFSLVFVPIVALVLGPKDAIATSMVLSSMLSLALYLEHRPRASVRDVSLLALSGIAATPLGLVVLAYAREDILRSAVALAIVVGAGANLINGQPERPQRKEPRWVTVGAGAASGAMRGATSFAGPPIVLYYHWIGGPPGVVRSHLFAYMFYLGVPGVILATMAGLVTTEVWLHSLASLPAVGIGALVGRAVRPRLSAAWFRRSSMTLLVVTSAIAVAGIIVDSRLLA